jgi:hypothetical protein
MPIDQQQVEAVKTLKALGFTFAGGDVVSAGER